MSASNPTHVRRRLDSWKEIAGFFDRDERTVNRWEKERGLPVHRLPGTKGRVYAYSDELSAWLAAPRTETAVPDDSPPEVGGEDARLFVVPGVKLLGSGSTDEASAEVDVGKPGTTAYRRAISVAAVTVLCLGIVATALLFHFAPKPKGSQASGDASARPSADGRIVLASTPAHDAEAEQLYLKGRYYWNKRTPEDLNKSLDYFMQAVVHDPNYAQAYVGLADCYNLLREYSAMPASEAYPRALAAAKKAVELDDQSSEAHASLAFATFFGMLDVAGGEREFRRAIDLNPGNASAHHWLANALMALHRLPEALTEIDRAQALDPASSSILADKGNVLASVGRPDEALALLKQMEVQEPAFRSPHTYLKYLYFERGEYPAFFAELRKEAILTHNDSALSIADAGEKGLSSGGAKGMFEAIFRVQKQLYVRHEVSATELAQTAASLGRKDQALRYLEAAYEQKDSSLLYIKSDARLDSLHDEPAYSNLLARMNLPGQN
jgi:tetratricopeptide (TPR) repeat protein